MGAAVRWRICVDNSKAAFFQWLPPLPKEVHKERQSSRQHKEGAVRRETWEYHSGTALSLGMKEQREGNVQKQLGGQQMIAKRTGNCRETAWSSDGIWEPTSCFLSQSRPAFVKWQVIYLPHQVTHQSLQQRRCTHEQDKSLTFQKASHIPFSCWSGKPLSLGSHSNIISINYVHAWVYLGRLAGMAGKGASVLTHWKWAVCQTGS